MSRVIKSYQYDRILPPLSPQPETVKPAPLPELGEAAPEEAAEPAREEAAGSAPKEREPSNEAAQAAAEGERARLLAEEEQKAAEAQRKLMIGRAFEKAKQIVDSAQAYSVQIARESAEKGREEFEEARQRGYSDGFARGMAEGKTSGAEAGRREGREEGKKEAGAENRRVLDELAVMIEAVEKNKTRILQEFESDLEELAFTMARTVLKKELSLDGGAMRSIIIGATDAYRNQSWLRIYVSDHTANVLLKADNSIVGALKNVSDNVKIVSAPGMDDGGCILEMPDQVIDAGIDSQLQKMKTAIESSGKNKTG